MFSFAFMLWILNLIRFFFLCVSLSLLYLCALPCVLFLCLITVSSCLATLLCCSLLGLAACHCALLFVFPCCSPSHLAICCHTLLFAFVLCCSLSHLATSLHTLHLVVHFLIFQVHALCPHCCFVTLLLTFTPCYCAFYGNWYSFPILLCRWKSLGQQQQASSNRLK